MLVMSGKGTEEIQGGTKETGEGGDKETGEVHVQKGSQAEGGQFEARFRVPSKGPRRPVPAEVER